MLRLAVDDATLKKARDEKKRCRMGGVSRRGEVAHSTPRFSTGWEYIKVTSRIVEPGTRLFKSC
jgi:hypothetical protein